MFYIRITYVLVYFQLFIGCIICSPGDDLYMFQECRYQCEQIICHKRPYHIFQRMILDELGSDGEYEIHAYNENWEFSSLLPLHLKLLGWDCVLNCDYECQRIVTKERCKNNQEICQFHGKWPFLRVFGIQEFASVIFSIGNYMVHAIGIKKVLEAKRQADPMIKYEYTVLIICSFIAMFAWICSTVFHIRDFLVTERLDYFVAGLTVLSGFYGVFTRYFRLYLPSRKLQRMLFTIVCILAYTWHIHRLVDDWLYTYNMQANITLGVLQNIIWGFLCFDLYCKYYKLENNEQVYKEKQSNNLDYITPRRLLIPSFYSRSSKLYSLYPLLLCAIVIAGMSLEIFDFPPIFFDLVDAHSLWHLVTIIPAFYGWYDWMIWDINVNVKHELEEFVQKKND